MDGDDEDGTVLSSGKPAIQLDTGVSLHGTIQDFASARNTIGDTPLSQKSASFQQRILDGIDPAHEFYQKESRVSEKRPKHRKRRLHHVSRGGESACLTSTGNVTIDNLPERPAAGSPPSAEHKLQKRRRKRRQRKKEGEYTPASPRAVTDPLEPELGAQMAQEFGGFSISRPVYLDSPSEVPHESVARREERFYANVSSNELLERGGTPQHLDPSQDTHLSENEAKKKHISRRNHWKRSPQLEVQRGKSASAISSSDLTVDYLPERLAWDASPVGRPPSAKLQLQKRRRGRRSHCRKEDPDTPLAGIDRSEAELGIQIRGLQPPKNGYLSGTPAGNLIALQPPQPGYIDSPGKTPGESLAPSQPGYIGTKSKTTGGSSSPTEEGVFANVNSNELFEREAQGFGNAGPQRVSVLASYVADGNRRKKSQIVRPYDFSGSKASVRSLLPYSDPLLDPSLGLYVDNYLFETSAPQGDESARAFILQPIPHSGIVLDETQALAEACWVKPHSNDTPDWVGNTIIVQGEGAMQAWMQTHGLENPCQPWQHDDGILSQILVAYVTSLNTYYILLLL